MPCAKDLVGVPFVDRGRDVVSGLDCWGLAMEVFRRYGIALPEYSICCHDSEGFAERVEIERPRWTRRTWPDVPAPAIIALKFNAPIVNHVGVYLGNGEFIHTREKTGCVIEHVDSPIWRHRIEGFYTYGTDDTDKVK